MSETRWRPLLTAAFLIVTASADAAEIKVLSTVAVKAVMEELIPQFERASGHKVVIQFGTTAVLKNQIDAGDAFDVGYFHAA